MTEGAYHHRQGGSDLVLRWKVFTDKVPINTQNYGVYAAICQVWYNVRTATQAQEAFLLECQTVSSGVIFAARCYA